ncbi:(d)CMP kinase [Garciella nitratireducens]|uniref:Cytidylate kinase n=1 Tax=Garciella nitratireducens DSM 15102 TaxID=1121911 RepID=A0A1T4JVL6_9FIRM|nr:(d)CMP kinase [Garciella nitratireducens]SJZ34095.1 cytidylate kinase [Garciella nitratireducens DSM 15102]
MEKMHIAIDGPAGAGKSTIAKSIAKKLDITYIDTGAMYRALTYKVLKELIDLNNNDIIINIVNKTTIELDKNKVFLDKQDVSNEIRHPIINNNVSKIARIPEVRMKMVEIQREIAYNKSVVMDGRDIGTYVLPNANYKFYLTASIDERAYRRYLELKKKGILASFQDIKNEIINRDKMDTERSIAPLRPAQDAIIINTTSKSIKMVINEIIDLIGNEGK